MKKQIRILIKPNECNLVMLGKMINELESIGVWKNQMIEYDDTDTHLSQKIEYILKKYQIDNMQIKK